MIADNETIYLDNNATTQVDPAVIEEMLPFLTSYYGNPSGIRLRGHGQESHKSCAGTARALLGCEPTALVFTSGGTESNNAVINSALQLETRGGHVVASGVEHSAVLRPRQDLAKRGCAVTFLGVDRHGNLDLGELEAAIRPETALVSIMWANNETGVVFPWRKSLKSVARKARFFTQTRTATGKILMCLRDTAINFSFSAHKFHAQRRGRALRRPANPLQSVDCRAVRKMGAVAGLKTSRRLLALEKQRAGAQISHRRKM
jgi:cysteine desulfurase